jgi:hypothetical protein
LNRNGDNVVAPTPAVDSSDLSILGASWMETHVDPYYKWNADANGDLRNDSSDLSILGANWMQSLPEPSPGPLAALAASLPVAALPVMEDDESVAAAVDRIFGVADADGDISAQHGPTDALVDGVLTDVIDGLARRKRREQIARRGGAVSEELAADTAIEEGVASDVQEGFVGVRRRWRS